MLQLPSPLEVAVFRARRSLREDAAPRTWVYRLEDARGHGPYCWRDWNRFLFANRHLETPPPPLAEINPARRLDFDYPALRTIFPEGLKAPQNPKVFYGFEHLEDVLPWFGEVGIRYLASHGYELKQTPAALAFPSMSRRQVAFFRAAGESRAVAWPPGVKVPVAPYPLVRELLTPEQKRALVYLL